MESTHKVIPSLSFGLQSSISNSILNLVYNVQNWEWSFGHVADTVLTAASLLPVAGGVVKAVSKIADHTGSIVKAGKKLLKSSGKILNGLVSGGKSLFKFGKKAAKATADLAGRVASGAGKLVSGAGKAIDKGVKATKSFFKSVGSGISGLFKKKKVVEEVVTEVTPQPQRLQMNLQLFAGKGANETKLLPAPQGTNPWVDGGDIASIKAPKDFEINMAMAPGQTRPGGWGTLDDIPNVNYVRNPLAVTPEFKPEVSKVQRWLVPEGTRIQIGDVGPQTYKGILYPGGGNQVQILNYSDRAKLIPLGDAINIK